MVFSSGIFLFMFLPVVLIGNYLLRNKPVMWRNLFLLIMSLGFYVRSGIKELMLLLLSIVINYMLARLIAANKERAKLKRLFLALAVCYNILMLFVFKYFVFVTDQLSRLIPWLDNALEIALPLGISFYTFQAMSYVIDVYRNPEYVEKSFFNVALYVSFFPQLVAGPIVRWESIRAELTDRTGDINKGLARFAIGLGKKSIISNQMAVFADAAFDLLATGELTSGFAWMGMIAYTLQIYYDFSGYSDMAIGLGTIFGFKFPQNFNYPYISKSVTEFWRRWHISLSSWFRDYVYIPLGGNRCSRSRMYLNLFIVWMLTGIWHGANYTFWLWGLGYFIVLIIEKALFDRNDKQASDRKNLLVSILQHTYTMLIVMCLWVLFRAGSVEDAVNYLAHLIGINATNSQYAVGVTALYARNSIGYFVIAIIGCLPLKNIIIDKLQPSEKVMNVLSQVWTLFVFILACCIIVDSNYNPFIYFNF